jgi:chromosome segregation ATPase
VSAGIHEWPGRKIGTGDGGPSGPTLEERVTAPEQRVERIDRKIDRIESKLDRHDEAFRRIEDALKSLALDHKDFVKSQMDLREKVAHIDGRLANIPTFWQTLALQATLLLGIAGLIFTSSRLLHP